MLLDLNIVVLVNLPVLHKIGCNYKRNASHSWIISVEQALTTTNCRLPAVLTLAGATLVLMDKRKNRALIYTAIVLISVILSILDTLGFILSKQPCSVA